jgi:Tfp pilus assembly protein PilF
VRQDSASYPRAQELLGVIAIARGDAAGARAHLERASRSGSPTARVQLARALIGAGDVEAAREELNAILEVDVPAEVQAQARRLRLGIDRPDLEDDLERAGRAALAGSGRALDDARDAFERVLAVEPKLWEAHFGLGLVARRREDAAAAATAFRRALELSPAQPDALHELGVALLAAGENAEALRALDEAATLRPRDAGYLADAGFAHLRAGDLAAARERLRVATEIDADDPLTRAYVDELERAEASARPN